MELDAEQEAPGPPPRVSIGVDADGRPVTVKHATGAAAARLVREADALAAARHPGVVELVDRTVTPDGITIRTRHAGNRTAASCDPLEVAEVAGLVAALAGTVADLHAAGVAHGRIRPEHVVVSASGRPVLCGFAEATLGVSGAARAADVAGVGEVLTSLLTGPDVDEGAVPERRPRWRPERTGAERRGLLTLADHATHPDPTRRPSARQLAAAIADTVPAARLPSAEAATGGAPGSTDDPAGPDARRATRGASTGADLEEHTEPDGSGRAPARSRAGRSRPGGRPVPTWLGALAARGTDDPARRLRLAVAVVAVLVVAVAGVLAGGWLRPDGPGRAGTAPTAGDADVAGATAASSAEAAAGSGAGPGAAAPTPADPTPPATADPAAATPTTAPSTAGEPAPTTPTPTSLGGGTDGATPEDPADPVDASAPPTATDGAPGDVALAAGCDTTVDGSARTASGTPCTGELRLVGAELVVEGDRFDLGGSPIAAAVGDWDCDGTPTPVVLADGGEVIAFDRWADADAAVDGRVVGRVDRPTRALAETTSEGCHLLVVLDHWGLRHLVEPEVTP
jgi:hypothetical protein